MRPFQLKIGTGAVAKRDQDVACCLKGLHAKWLHTRRQ